MQPRFIITLVVGGGGRARETAAQARRAVRSLLTKGMPRVKSVNRMHGDEKLHCRSTDHLILRDAEIGDLPAVKLHVRADRSLANCRGEYNYTPLCLAAKKHPDVVSYLINVGAEVAAHDNFGHAPLHWASQKGNVEVIELLLEAGADVNTPNNGGYTPLILAVHHGWGLAAKRLIDAGADCAAKTMQNITALKLVQTTRKKHDFQGVFTAAVLGAILETRAPGSGCPPENLNKSTRFNAYENAQRVREKEEEFNKREKERLAAMGLTGLRALPTTDEVKESSYTPEAIHSAIKAARQNSHLLAQDQARRRRR